jgi:hypothetical protein
MSALTVHSVITPEIGAVTGSGFAPPWPVLIQIAPSVMLTALQGLPKTVAAEAEVGIAATRAVAARAVARATDRHFFMGSSGWVGRGFPTDPT